MDLKGWEKSRPFSWVNEDNFVLQRQRALLSGVFSCKTLQEQEAENTPIP